MMMVLAGALIVSCGGTDTGSPVDTPSERGSRWRPVAEAEMTSAQQEQLDRAIVATDTMAKEMMGELKGELEVGGPSGAVVVCRDLAPMISEHVGEEHGVLIGRTSHRLRNPENVAPEWAAEWVARRDDRPAYLEGPSGELGVLLPIRLMKPCLACHGASDALDGDVLAALAESYPEDRAVGFAEGDLRGWFWVEVPGDESG
jgi:hypothetical protein